MYTDQTVEYNSNINICLKIYFINTSHVNDISHRRSRIRSRKSGG